MVNIYTAPELVPEELLKSSLLIEKNDSYFMYSTKVHDLDSVCKNYMREIDGAELIDEKIKTIKTDFGTADISKLSTGLKTLLNTYLWRDEKSLIVDITECGKNVLDKVISVAESKPNISFILWHYHVPESFSVPVKINSEHVYKANDDSVSVDFMGIFGEVQEKILWGSEEDEDDFV